MPIYEYRCGNGHNFEVLQRMSDEPVAACETCEAPVRRVFHPIAVHFKGSGFYNTDYGTKNRQRETAAAGEGSSGEGKGGEGKGGEGKGGEGKGGEGKGGEGKGEGSSDGKKGEGKKADGAKKAESSSSSPSTSSSSSKSE